MSKKSKTKGKRPLQVLFLPTDEGGCGWYRIRQFNDAFQLRDDVKSYLMDGKEPSEDQVELIKNADVVVARMAAFQYVKMIKEEIAYETNVVSDINT